MSGYADMDHFPTCLRPEARPWEAQLVPANLPAVLQKTFAEDFIDNLKVVPVTETAALLVKLYKQHSVSGWCPVCDSGNSPEQPFSLSRYLSTVTGYIICESCQNQSNSGLSVAAFAHSNLKKEWTKASQ